MPFVKSIIPARDASGYLLADVSGTFSGHAWSVKLLMMAIGCLLTQLEMSSGKFSKPS